MYLSPNILKRIFLFLIGLAILLGAFVIYLYFPTLMNRFGLNKTPSKEVQQLLTDYNTTQTPERYIEMDKEVGRMAVSSPSLDITNCTPYPRIIKSNVKSSLIIINRDRTNRTITIGDQVLIVQAKSLIKLEFPFVKSTPKIMPYNCDDLNSFTGILYVTGTI